MITVEEIRKKAARIYPDILRSSLLCVESFPLNLRSDKKLSKDFAAMSREIAHLMSEAKDRKGYGYNVISEKVKTRSHGFQDIPLSIRFDTLQDFLKFIGKVKEYEEFECACNLINSEIPELKEWTVKNPLKIVQNQNEWENLLKVCKWFLHNYRRGEFYIRELPIDIHTKFIEANTGVIKSLLEVLIPDRIKHDERMFEKRFGLKYAEPRIRIRFLDERLFVEGRFKDISIPLHEFADADFDCRRIIITENKMNFLTLPEMKDAVAIWGGGFAVKNLKDIEWLKGKAILYWGDIDAQGFEILAQLRSYYPQTISVMMDKETFNRFAVYQAQGTKSNIILRQWLTDAEQELYNLVREKSLRLEQEKIPQRYVDKIFSQ
ncbi:Wadjet anti-phage system protein JetD domain-containing protein [Pedobacter nanyangensis]|uniref:Wadjet anti-phage system protein JetD domain-containing protein n=1 Tax=Pedobacter nanyangensis TaxID=1562389 RepID=UPI000DE55642|nr:DUF3322 and DUF2220 domain-containing protein [Pedobacter nanyangensis]